MSTMTTVDIQQGGAGAVPPACPVREEIDAALKAEVGRRESEQKAAIKIFGREISITAVLRVIGAAAVIGSGFAFLLQRVNTADHMVRYAMFLALTSVICGLGFFCGLRLKENKGARTLLLLTLAVVPVHFMQLGALLFSQFGDHSLVQRANESVFAWMAPSPSAALLSLGVGLIVLVPMIVVAMRTLVRPHATALMMFMVGTNAMMLVPTREPTAIAIAAALLCGVLIYMQRVFVTGDASLKTKEANLVRAILWAPLPLILGRTVHLYASDVNALFVSVFLAITAEILFTVSATTWGKGAPVRFFQLCSLVPGVLAPLVLGSSVRHYVPQDLWIPFFGFSVAGYLFLTSLRRTELAAAIRSMSLTTIGCTAALQMLTVHSPTSSFLLIACSILILLNGYEMRNRNSFVIGLIGVAYGIVYHVRYAIELYSVSPWISLAAIGLGAVVLASYLEGNAAMIRERIRVFRSRFAKA